MIRLFALALIACACLLPTSPAHARTDAGDLLWQDRFDLAGGEDIARAVAAANGRVVVVGSAQNAAGNSDFVVRAYDAKSGALLWKDRVDVAGGDDAATAVVLDDDRVIVAGTGIDPTGGSRLLLRVYIAKNGQLAWEDRPGIVAFNGLAADGAHVVVAVTTTDSTGNPQLVVRAYVAKNGIIGWQDQPQTPIGYGGLGGATRGVIIHGQRAFVVGTTRMSGGEHFVSCFVRAYVVKTGQPIWDSLHRPPSQCIAEAIATDGKRVIVAARGATGLDDYLAQSYDAETGQFLWEDRTFVSTGYGNAAVAADTERRQAFVVGWVMSVNVPGNREAFLVRAYDADTGTMNWEDQFRSYPESFDHAHDVVVEKNRVIAVGAGGGTWLVRAYDAKGGDLLWSDEFAPVGGIPNLASGALAVAADGGKIFVAGSGLNANGNADFIVRAYDAK
jgi:hypothetical protein